MTEIHANQAQSPLMHAYFMAAFVCKHSNISQDAHGSTCTTNGLPTRGASLIVARSRRGPITVKLTSISPFAILLACEGFARDAH